MSDSFLYSGDDAVMMSELQHCCVASKKHSGISSESETGLSVGTAMALAPECDLKFMYVHLCKLLFNNSLIRISDTVKSINFAITKSHASTQLKTVIVCVQYWCSMSNTFRREFDVLCP